MARWNRRTVDGQENPYSVTFSNKFYEVQKYVSSTNHTNSYNIIIVSKKFWDKLSPTEQRLMREAYEESREFQKQQTQLAVEKSLAGLKEKGMTFTDIALPELARMRDATKPVIEKFLGEYDAETVKPFNAEIERVQKNSIARRSTRRCSRSMHEVLDWYCGLIKVLAVACLAGMVVLVFGNVVLRYGFNSGIVVSEEAARWLLVWLTFLGAIVALQGA